MADARRDGAAEPPYETRDVGGRMMAMIAGVVAVAVLLPLGGISLLYGWVAPAPGSGAAVHPAPVDPDPTPAPQLQRVPRQDLDVLNRRAAAHLSGLGWVDRDAGIAHIPIEDAMRLVVERGGAGQ